ncbi:MAG: AtpZ/AtpI family protein [Deltaproteobacteria bacterium]|nr:AtpZ/AtpI family protein [Deltaproteobacteria bacterium]
MILAKVSSMGLAMVLATVIGMGLGLWMDSAWDTGPWGFIGGLILGIIAGFRNLYIILKRSNLL